MKNLFLAAIILSIGAGSGKSASFEPEASLPSANVGVVQNDLSSARLVVNTPLMSPKLSKGASGETVSRIGLDQEPSTSQVGWPELPMITRLFLIPPDCGVRVELKALKQRTEAGVEPFIVPVQDGIVDPDISGTPDEAYLKIEGFWPPEPVTIGSPAILRGNRLLPVTVHPVQYNPSTGEYRYNETVDFELVYEGDPINPVIHPERPRPSRTIKRLIESLVVNPPANDPGRDDPRRGSYLIVHLNANGIANSLAPLIAWRKRQGWEVQVMGFAVNTQYNDIRTQILRAYNEWETPPEMVALIGDPDNAGFGIPAWPNFTDLDYAMLEGNDILADLDYGRISCRSIQELDRVVGKIVNYESDPFMQDTDWYHQGAVVAGSPASGLSSILVNKWVRRETMDRGWNSVSEYYHQNGQPANTVQAFANEFRRGVSYITYRGWIGMEGMSTDAILNYQAHRRYPFATTMSCATGHYAGQFCFTEAFFISAGGAIASIGFATANTHTPYNNAVFTGIWFGLLKRDMWNVGTASNYGRYEIFRQYGGHDDQRVADFSRWANLMGDPATEMWTDIPQRVRVDHEESVSLGTTDIRIALSDEDGNNAIANAQVCLFKAGDELQLVEWTGEDGVAKFNMPSDALTAGDLLVTVTKHNVKPYLGTIEVGEVEQFIGAGSWNVSDDDNGDGEVNDGERFDLNIDLTNFGTERPDGALTVAAESLSPWAEMTGDDVELQAAPAAGESAAITFGVHILPAAPNETIIPIAFNTRNGQSVWPSIAALQVVAPHIVQTAAFIPNNRFDPGTNADIDFSLSNIGGRDINSFSAHLISENSALTIINADVNYPAIEVGDTLRAANGGRFRIESHRLAVPGMKAKLKLAIEDDRGFRDTTFYEITIGRPAAGDPFGPDKYGYVCFDSGDTTWEMAPAYDWIEIDPNVQNRRFNGTRLDINDPSEDQDESVLVDLPFDFQYYGEVFDRLTICTNGWAAFGAWTELQDFRNLKINSGGGPNGMLCVLWEDLIMRQSSGISTFYDEENGRFIVEWNGMITQADNNSVETFQLILFDTQMLPTYTGDGVIVFQYKEARNVNAGGQSLDSPYVTVGINSPSDLDGIEYTYWNSYPAGARALANQMAIKFTTAVQFIRGGLEVQVADLATGMPVSGAAVITSRGGFGGETDENGVCLIDDILIGDYDYLRISKQGYNDSTWTGDDGAGFTINEGEVLSVGFALLHPEFNTDLNSFEFNMLSDSTAEAGFQLSNDGNGTLEFTSRFTVIEEDEVELAGSSTGGPMRDPGRDDADEQWDELMRIEFAEIVDNPRLSAIAYVDDHWVITGGHSLGNRVDTLNYFYEFSKDGEYTGNRYPQPTFDSFGLKDMEYYNGLLYCAFSQESKVLAVDPTTFEVVRELELPGGFNNARNLTIDARSGHFWMAGVSTGVYELEVSGDTTFTILNRFQLTDPRNGDRPNIYGHAWFRDDPDGFQLYLIGTDEIPGQNPEHADIALYKMNPANGELRFLTDLPGFDPRTRASGGITITPRWDNRFWCLAVAFDHGEGDYLSFFELAPNSSWIDYTPRSDTLFASEQVPIEITIETTALDTGHYGVNIEFSHNAGEGVTQIPVNLNIVTELAIEPMESLTPMEYSLEPNFPNPFNGTTMIDYSLGRAGLARIELFDLQGRKIKTLLADQRAAGHHRITLELGEMAAGVYFYRLKAGEFTASRKMLLIK